MPVGAVLLHAMLLGGSRYRVTCPNCHRDGYLARDRQNVLWPLTVLALGLITSLPSPLSDSYLSSLSREWAAIVRAEIWAITTLTAFALFAFGGRLTPLPAAPEMSAGHVVRGRIVILAFQVSMLLWMYVMFRGLMMEA
jgi:hypothetical protein